MSSVQASHFCPHCQRQRLYSKESVVGLPAGCICTVLTGGLFLLLWLPLAILDATRPLRCQDCGHARGSGFATVLGVLAMLLAAFAGVVTFAIAFAPHPTSTPVQVRGQK